jgi:hypothetical protein
MTFRCFPFKLEIMPSNQRDEMYSIDMKPEGKMPQIGRQSGRLSGQDEAA